jgi:C4-dicarboxylate-specific signal transduction histidine kinase
MLADLVMTALANGGTELTRAVTSLAFADCMIRLSADATHPDILFLSVDGQVSDDRSFWTVRASEQRYRNLLYHLPTALLQIDASAIGEVYQGLRRSGITDLRRHVEENPELIATANRIVMVTDANARAADLLGAADVAQLIGPVCYLFEASPEAALRVMIARFEGRRSHADTMRLRTFDGRLLDVAITVTYPMPPERLDVTLISLEDISDRLRTDAQLRQLQADYSRAARISMLGELATSIAHEVNQPLSAIVTNAETNLRWLSRDVPNLEKVGQLTARIAESARRASDIVQRIRGMAARREPERVPLDLNDVIDEALIFVRHETESRSIALVTKLGDRLPLVLGDRVQLQQVIVNLLINAVQALALAGATHGRIELETSDTGDSVTFTIRDSGPGIAQDHLERIFGSFFTTKDDGIGIGLALCQSIIAAHGGTIAVSNHPDGGAIFRFSLPAAKA